MRRVTILFASALVTLIVVNLLPDAPPPQVTILFQAYANPKNPLGYYPLLEKTRAAFGKRGFTDAWWARNKLPYVCCFEVFGAQEVLGGKKEWQQVENAIRRMREVMPDVSDKEIAEYYPPIAIGAILLHLDRQDNRPLEPKVELIKDICTCEQQVDAFLGSLSLPKKEIKEDYHDPLLPDEWTVPRMEDWEWLSLLPNWLLEGTDYRIKLTSLIALPLLVGYFLYQVYEFVKHRRHPPASPLRHD